MNVKKLKEQLKEMKVNFDEVSFYFQINNFGFTEISKSKFYQLGQEALRA